MSYLPSPLAFRAGRVLPGTRALLYFASATCLLALLEALPAEVAARVRHWSRQPRVVALRDDSKLRLSRLLLRGAKCVAAGQCSEPALLRFVDWVEPLLRRESYLALLVERFFPQRLSQRRHRWWRVR